MAEIEESIRTNAEGPAKASGDAGSVEQHKLHGTVNAAMIAVKVTTKKSIDKVKRKVQQGNFKSLGHAAATIRLVARRSIRKRKTAAMPGSPPNTRRGQLKRSIMYAIDKQRGIALIGPDFDVIATAGKAHEFGGKFRREHYPKRPFMGPALNKVKDRLPPMWANSVG